MAAPTLHSTVIGDAGKVAVVNAAGTGYEPGSTPMTAATLAAIGAKPAARVAATVNVASLSAPQTVDGVALVAEDRVLLTAQSTGHQNGVWVVKAGAWARPTDWATGGVAAGAVVPVVGGTSARSQWMVTTTAAITVGSTAVTLAKVQAASGDVTGLAAAIAATKLSALAAPDASVSMGSQRITNVTDPSGAQDAATKASVDAAIAVHTSDASAAHAASAISFAPAAGIAATDVQAAFVELAADALAAATALRLDQLALPTSDLSANSHKITGLAAPTNAGDAARKSYVDTAAAGKVGLAYAGILGSLPTADVALRGQLAVIQATTGGRDKLVVCLKGADDGYDWIDVATGTA